MPIEPIPTINDLLAVTIDGEVFNNMGISHEIVLDNNITKIIGGGNETQGSLHTNYPHMNTNFQKIPNPLTLAGVTPHAETSLISISPVSVREKVNKEGANPQNCSLYNRAIQAKLMIGIENTETAQLLWYQYPRRFYGDMAPQIDFDAYAGDTAIAISDYNSPTLTLNETALVTYTGTTVIGKVYESAYYYFSWGGSRLNSGSNAFNNDILDSPPPSITDSAASYGVYHPGMQASKEWVIKNGEGDHRDWSYTYSDTPNGDEFVTFNEDHWLIYDFGVNDQQIIGKIKLEFSYSDAHRHNHIEIYGSNYPTWSTMDEYMSDGTPLSYTFINNPPTENVHHFRGPGQSIEPSTENQTWTYICDLTNTVSEGTFTSDGIIDQELTNTTIEGTQYGGTNNVLYRWYMLRFKSDGFEDDELRVQRIKFYKKDISNVSEVKMSDFYGLYIINCLPATPHIPGYENPRYLSGYRIDVATSGEIRLGGNSS